MKTRFGNLLACSACALVLAFAGSVITVPSVLSVTGAILVVNAVEVSARGTVIVLERASDGALVSVEIVGSGVAAASMVVGTAVTVSVIGAGVDVWGRKYQQSNQWVIETLAAAMAPTIATRAQAHAWLQFNGYEPATLRIGPLTRLGGRMGSANVAFDDHPPEKRFSDRIETVTADSVLSWLERSGLGGPAVAIGARAAR